MSRPVRCGRHGRHCSGPGPAPDRHRGSIRPTARPRSRNGWAGSTAHATRPVPLACHRESAAHAAGSAAPPAAGCAGTRTARRRPRHSRACSFGRERPGRAAARRASARCAVRAGNPWRSRRRCRFAHRASGSSCRPCRRAWECRAHRNRARRRAAYGNPGSCRRVPDRRRVRPAPGGGHRIGASAMVAARHARSATPARRPAASPAPPRRPAPASSRRAHGCRSAIGAGPPVAGAARVCAGAGTGCAESQVRQRTDVLRCEPLRDLAPCSPAPRRDARRCARRRVAHSGSPPAGPAAQARRRRLPSARRRGRPGRRGGRVPHHPAAPAFAPCAARRHRRDWAAVPHRAAPAWRSARRSRAGRRRPAAPAGGSSARSGAARP